MSALIWLALDGIGHPLDAPAHSVWEQDLPTLRPLIDAGRALDATLGVPGLPQSGTGQTCWLTGQNAVQVMGEHFGPHPGPTLQKLLRAHSLPVRLRQAGARAALVNVYAEDYLNAAPGGRNRMGCFPFSFQAAGWPLNPPELPLLRASLGLTRRYDLGRAQLSNVTSVSYSNTHQQYQVQRQRLETGTGSFIYNYTDEQAQTADVTGVRRWVRSFITAVDVLYLTIDLDVLPAAVAPGVSAPAGFGVPYEVIHACAVEATQSGKLALADVVELNPALDVDGRTAKAAARLIHTIVSRHRTDASLLA